MFCFKYKKLLMPYSEGLLPDDTRERVHRHLESCDRCLGELRAITSAAQALRAAQISAMEPSAEIWNRIRERIQPPPKPVPFWRVRNFQAASAALVGTTLLLFVFIKPIYQPQDKDIAERYSVERPEVVDKIQPLTRSAAEPVAKQEVPAPAQPSTDLKFGGETAELTPPHSYMPAEPNQIAKSPGYRDHPSPPQPHLLSPSADQGQAVVGSPQRGWLSQPPAAAGSKDAPPVGTREAGRLSDRSPAPTVARATDLAELAPQSGDAKATIAAAPEASRLSPDADKWLLRQDYIKKLEKNPNDIQTIQQLAEVEKQLGNKAAVVGYRRKLTELQPREASRWVDLGDAYEANSQPTQASDAYRRALRIGLPREQAIDVNRKLQRLKS